MAGSRDRHEVGDVVTPSQDRLHRNLSPTMQECRVDAHSLRHRGIAAAELCASVRATSGGQDQGWSLSRLGKRLGEDHSVVRNAIRRSGQSRSRGSETVPG